MAPLECHLYALEPQARERVWGGQFLHPADPPIGEEWVAYGPSRVSGGPCDGLSVDDLAERHGADLLGTTVAGRFGTRFPLLVKLLDCADWLSVQVHPNDEQALRMVGPNEFGKTEAWYFLSTSAGAQIMLGVNDGVTREDLVAAIRGGRVRDVAHLMDIQAGESVLVPAGTLHALGPGIVLYEIQQASDTTYRVYDWDRPSSAGRQLHVEQSIEVAAAVGPARLTRPTIPTGTDSTDSVDSRYFDLDLLRATEESGAFVADTHGQSFHILTVIEGAAEIEWGDERLALGRFGTALVAGSAGEYRIGAVGGPVKVLRAAVPD